MDSRTEPTPSVDRDRTSAPSKPPDEGGSVRPAGAYEPNAILRWLYRRFFAHIHVDEHWSDVVRTAATRGVVVYVMRSISFLDFLCLDFLVKQFALPLVRFVNDLGLWILEPFGKGGRRLRLRRQIPEDRALSATVSDSHSALLFLRRPPAFARSRHRGEALDTDLLRTLVETQRQMDKPILLVPQTFVWSKLPPKRKRSWRDLVFGPSEWPGRVRVFFQFLFNFRNALLRSGEPLDLAQFIEQSQDLTDAEVADRVRWALLRRIERERVLVHGPTNKTPERIREEILRSPRVRRTIVATARASGKSIPAIEKEAAKELRKLCAMPDPYVVRMLKWLLDRIWNRIYDGIVVDYEGIERVRDAAREGALVLLPSHKSHVDYLIMSEVMDENAMSPPLVAAGDNLSFWPLGPVLRRGGAFFIRRSFKGKKLYAALVDAYIRKVLVEGFHVEFFLEGGRSRTGKLLPPKLGLLSMAVDAALRLSPKRIHFVPVSIVYDRIIEERSYVHELGGGEKQKENLGNLLKTPRILRSKYGRLYVQFGKLLAFEDAMREAKSRRGARKSDRPPAADGAPAETSDRLDTVGGLAPSERRDLVRRLAHRVIYEIDRSTIVTPASLVATALLAHRRRGMKHEDLLEMCRALTSALRQDGARTAPTVLDERGELRPDSLGEAVELFVDGKLVLRHGSGDEAIYRVPNERRLALEYYKNNILHFFVASALISAAVLAGDAEPVSETMLRERVRKLSRLFKYEFMYRADAPFDEIFDGALSRMLEAGELERFADHVRMADGSPGKLVPIWANMLRTYFESYRLALRAADLVRTRNVSKRDWLKQAMAIGERMYLSGEIELRESLSRPKLENALLSLRDHDIVAFGEQGEQLQAGPEMAEIEDVRALERRIRAYL